MFYFTNYVVLIAISNIMKGVINYEKIDMISKFYNSDAQMLLSETNIFTALHPMQTRPSDENSVCRSVKRVHYDKTEERSVHIFISYERSCSLVFLEEEWLVGATPST